MNRAASHEPDPTGNGTTVLPLVLQDLKDRAEMGKQKYGTYLRTMNGRSALMDAYQEALDLVMYLRQEIEENKETEPSDTELFLLARDLREAVTRKRSYESAEHVIMSVLRGKVRHV